MINIIGGCIAVAVGILALLTWPWRVLEVVQGVLPIVLIIGGIVAVVAGWELTKENKAALPDEEEPATVMREVQE